MNGRTLRPVRTVSQFLVIHSCSVNFLRQLPSHSRSLSNIPRLLVRIAAILGLRPHGHLSACLQHPTQSGPWIRSLPLRAYSVEGGRLHAVPRNQAARIRLASEFISVLPHFDYTSGTWPVVHKLDHRFDAHTGFDELRYMFWTTQLSPFNHLIFLLADLRDTILLPSTCL